MAKIHRLKRGLVLSALLCSIVFTLAAIGCSPSSTASHATGEPTGAGDSTKLKVASTVSPITSLAENIGGDRIQLTGIVPEGTNSHTFEPAPSVAAILTDADLFIANGLFLEEPTIRMAEVNLKEGAVHLILGPRTITEDEWVFDFSFPQEDGHPNPHLWTDPHLALKYAEHIRDELVKLDKNNAEYYQGNFEKLAAKNQRPGPKNSGSSGYYTSAEPQAAYLPRFFPLLRPQVRIRDYRRNPAFGLYGTLGPGGCGVD